MREFIASKPMYILMVGAIDTPAADIEKATKQMFASARKHGRNPVLVGITDNAVSATAKAIADEQHVPSLFGSVDDVIKDLDSRRLCKENIQVVIFQTPEYAGSEEALNILYGCRQVDGTLRMWSNFHAAWLNSQWNIPWVREFNNKFLRTLNSYSLENEEKSALFAQRMMYLQRFPVYALFIRKERISA